MRLAVVIAILVGLAAPARAGDPAWYKGTTPQQREKASALFAKANTFFEQSEYAKAIEIYRQALASWDNPGIRFNLAVSLLNLDRVLEALEHLDAAMQYGAAGLDAQRFKEAQTYKRLLEGRVVRFEVETVQAGVEVTFDGKPIVQGAPRKVSLTVLPGAHALVATKAGFETVTKNLVLVGGAPVRERIELSPRQRRTAIKRRFRTWVPWTIAGVGAGASLLGLGAMTIARSHMSQFESDFQRECGAGCAESDVDWSLHDRAKLENYIGLGLVGAGGAAIVTGLVMVALNQPREVEAPPVAVRVTGDGVGVTWFGSF